MIRLLPFTYAARNLGRNGPRLILAVSGSFAVALLAMAGAGFVRGMEAALRASGLERNVMLLGAGSEESVERSEISQATSGVIAASLPGVAVHDRQPLASAEVNVALTVQAERGGDARAEDRERTGLVRGVTRTAFLVHPQVRLVAGRAPEAGSDEVILGTSAARVAGLAPEVVRTSLQDDGTGGPAVLVDGRTRRVVGMFAAPGTVMDGETWMPLTDTLVLTQRETVSAVIVTLAPQAEPADIEAFAQRRIDLELTAIREPDYYASQGAFYRPVRVMVLASAVLVAVGALLGGLNTLYAAFASRVRELGMLQVLGFTRGAIAVSLLQESVILAMSGTLIAVGMAIAFLDGISIHFSMGTFGLRIDERVVAIGLGAGLLVGVVGCVLPALRCLRMPLPSALKSD